MHNDGESATSLLLEDTLDEAERLAAIGDLAGLLATLDPRWIQLVTEHPGRLHRLLSGLPADFTAQHPRLTIARDVLFQMHDRSGVPSTLSLESRFRELAESGEGLADLVAISLGQAIALRMMRAYEAARDVAQRGRAAVAANPAQWRAILPEQRGMILLHWALGRLLAGDFEGALVDLEDSYEASLRDSRHRAR